MSLQDQVALVTGASSGIGAAVARHLGRANAKVVLAARNQSALARVAREVVALGGQALIQPTDVRDATQCQRLIQRAQEQWGRLDILINNAGLGFSNPVGQLDPDEVRQQIETNLLGVIWCSNAAVPLMRQQRSGTIINIGSVAGRIGMPTTSVYSATKFGLDGFTQSLHSEVAAHGIDVVLLNPGFVATDFSRRASRGGPDDRLRPGPELTADEVALAVMRLIEHPQRQQVISWHYRLITGVQRFAPGVVAQILARVGRRIAG